MSKLQDSYKTKTQQELFAHYDKWDTMNKIWQ